MKAIQTYPRVGLARPCPSHGRQSERSTKRATARRDLKTNASETTTVFDMSFDFWHVFGLHVVITKDKHTWEHG
jgi:hypothetical protein